MASTEACHRSRTDGHTAKTFPRTGAGPRRTTCRKPEMISRPRDARDDHELVKWNGDRGFQIVLARAAYKDGVARGVGHPSLDIEWSHSGAEGSARA